MSAHIPALVRKDDPGILGDERSNKPNGPKQDAMFRGALLRAIRRGDERLPRKPAAASFDSVPRTFRAATYVPTASSSDL